MVGGKSLQVWGEIAQNRMSAAKDAAGAVERNFTPGEWFELMKTNKAPKRDIRVISMVSNCLLLQFNVQEQEGLDPEGFILFAQLKDPTSPNIELSWRAERRDQEDWAIPHFQSPFYPKATAGIGVGYGTDDVQLLWAGIKPVKLEIDLSDLITEKELPKGVALPGLSRGDYSSSVTILHPRDALNGATANAEAVTKFFHELLREPAT